jgi:hypothetical protein
MDAFGKVRVSNPYTTLDLKFPGQATGTTNFLSNNMIETNTSTGSFTGSFENSKCIMSGTGLGKYVNQSRKISVYQPGKSTLFLGSGIIYNGPTGSDIIRDVLVILIIITAFILDMIPIVVFLLLLRKMEQVLKYIKMIGILIK